MFRHWAAAAVIAIVAVIACGCGVPGAEPAPQPPPAPPAPPPAIATDTTAYGGFFLYHAANGLPSVFSLKEGKAVWSGDSSDSYPGWSSDGKYVVFTRTSGTGSDLKVDLVFHSPFTGDERRVSLDAKMYDPEMLGDSCSMSPSGDYVLVDVWYGRPFVVDAKTGETVYVATGNRLFWAPSGNTLWEDYCTDEIAIEPGMWCEVFLTNVPDGEPRSIWKTEPDHHIVPCGWIDDQVFVFAEYSSLDPDQPPTIRDTAGRVYKESPLAPPPSPPGIGSVVSSSGPNTGLWVLGVQDPQLVIWLYDSATGRAIRTVDGAMPKWQPSRGVRTWPTP